MPESDADSKPVLVLGGTGRYGRHIVASLSRRSVRARVLSRNAEAARGVLGDGPEIVVGDITKRSDVTRALDGVRAMVIAVSALTPKLAARLWEIEHDAVLGAFEQAERVGVGRVVYLSGYHLDEELIERLDFELGRLKLKVERALARTELDWTVLGAPPSMDIFFETLRGDKMFVPGGGPRALPTVSPSDLGEIAAEAATRRDLSGQRFRVTGPEALSFLQAAERISAVLGRDIRVVAVPLVLPRLVAFIGGRFHPYLPHLVASMKLLNAFPPELGAAVSRDHRRLLDTFHYTPTALEMHAERRVELPVR